MGSGEILKTAADARSVSSLGFAGEKLIFIQPACRFRPILADWFPRRLGHFTVELTEVAFLAVADKTFSGAF